MLLPSEDRTHATSVGAGADREDNPRSQHHYRPLSTSRHFSPCEGKIPRRGLSAGGRQIRTCMGLLLSSDCLWLVGSLFGAGEPFFAPSPTNRFAERAEGVKGPKR